MKTKIIFTTLGFILAIGYSAFAAFESDINLFFEKKEIISQMEVLTSENDGYRKELATVTGAILELETTKTKLENKIQSNSNIWREYKGKLELIGSLGK